MSEYVASATQTKFDSIEQIAKNVEPKLKELQQKLDSYKDMDVFNNPDAMFDQMKTHQEQNILMHLSSTMIATLSSSVKSAIKNA